jgi:hypothetical protein
VFFLYLKEVRKIPDTMVSNIKKNKAILKRIILLSLSVALLFGIPARKAAAQNSVNAHAVAVVIEALTATETAELNFGRFSPETAGGVVKLTPDGVRSSAGTVALSGGTHNAASFYITGQYDATVSITLPSTPAVLTNSISSKTMEVSNWESLPAAGVGVGVLTDGKLDVNVGATLTVGDMNDNPVGIYSGTYSITFSYN